MEKLFGTYAEDIKEVRSLVNLWREEFERRTENGDAPIEKAKSYQARSCGYSESLTSNTLIVKQLWRHLDSTRTEHVPQEVSMYEQMASIDFQVTRTLIDQRDRPAHENDQERWQMLGMHNMRHYQEHRHQKAIEKELNQQLSDDSGSEDEHDLETLDVMASLKDQFANIK